MQGERCMMMHKKIKEQSNLKGGFFWAVTPKSLLCISQYWRISSANSSHGTADHQRAIVIEIV
jgi:hypothetical protein